MRGLEDLGVSVFLEEGNRQMVLLALATLANQRPGFLWALEQIALKMDNAEKTDDGVRPEMFTRLRELNRDRETPILGSGSRG